MTFQEALKQSGMSMYRLSKTSGIPYTTVHDICDGKAHLEKCSAETVYYIAKALNITMEELLSSYSSLDSRNFENFKSTVCHQVKEMGDLDFIEHILISNSIRKYFDKAWYAESLYLLAMLDYLSRVNNLPLCSEYDDLRQFKLDQPIYPVSLRAIAVVCKDDTILSKAAEEAIPEFKRFNIIENEVRNVV